MVSSFFLGVIEMILRTCNAVTFVTHHFEISAPLPSLPPEVAYSSSVAYDSIWKFDWATQLAQRASVQAGSFEIRARGTLAPSSSTRIPFRQPCWFRRSNRIAVRAPLRGCRKFTDRRSQHRTATTQTPGLTKILLQT